MSYKENLQLNNTEFSAFVSRVDALPDGNSYPTGKYLFSKKGTADGDIIGYSASDNLAAYPNGGWAKGYYWECVGGAIEFTVSRAGVITTYQAEEGMTWSEWVESEYNTNGYVMATISGVLTITDSTGYVLSENNLTGSSYYVLNTDKIVSGHTYYLNYVD